jgi:general stress protein 26
MPTEADLERRFWAALRSDLTVMLGLSDSAQSLRPMTAQVEVDRGPIWFFGSTDSQLVQDVQQARPGIASFAAKDHGLFARIEGTLRLDNVPAVIDRLWNRYVAAWYKGGKTDPSLALLRFDAEHAEIWLNESSVFAGLKMLLGMDPKERYKDSVAEVELGAKHS